MSGKFPAVILAVCCLISACSSGKANTLAASAESAVVNSGALATITQNYAASKFVAERITEDELNPVLQAGVRSPSARNRQPWHFTVVRGDAELAGGIIPNITAGNVIIVISGEGADTDKSVVLDCALATQNIYLAAQALGLGSRIYTGPIDTVNAKYRESLGLPGGYSAVALVRIGRIEPVDALSAASSRKNPDGMISGR
ncbi:MAG: nitroreductase family protein [Spirochaetales bacterium]|jgi:nitroreductase|nr:nitroreductase family protein [Spirochaetales bacterium]